MNVIQKFTTRVSKYGFKYVMKVILKNKVYRHIDRIYMAIGKVLWKNAKLTDTIILESHNDFDCNGGAFYDYLIREGYNLSLIHISEPTRLRTRSRMPSSA